MVYLVGLLVLMVPLLGVQGYDCPTVCNTGVSTTNGMIDGVTNGFMFAQGVLCNSVMGNVGCSARLKASQIKTIAEARTDPYHHVVNCSGCTWPEHDPSYKGLAVNIRYNHHQIREASDLSRERIAILSTDIDETGNSALTGSIIAAYGDDLKKFSNIKRAFRRLNYGDYNWVVNDFRAERFKKAALDPTNGLEPIISNLFKMMNGGSVLDPKSIFEQGNADYCKWDTMRFLQDTTQMSLIMLATARYMEDRPLPQDYLDSVTARSITATKTYLTACGCSAGFTAGLTGPVSTYFDALGQEDVHFDVERITINRYKGGLTDHDKLWYLLNVRPYRVITPNIELARKWSYEEIDMMTYLHGNKYLTEFDNTPFCLGSAVHFLDAPTDAVWSTQQCNVTESHDATTLVQCKEMCTFTPGCTAINYHQAASHCDMLECLLPAPQPAETRAGWSGHNLISDDLGYIGPLDRVPIDKFCNTIKDYGMIYAVQVCKSRCNQFSDCNSIKYNQKELRCILKDCNRGARDAHYKRHIYVDPRGIEDGWKGYYQYRARVVVGDGLGFVGPLRHAFSTDIGCKEMSKSHFEVDNHYSCQRHCSPQCNAVNYMALNNGTNLCHLYACPIPMPEPEGEARHQTGEDITFKDYNSRSYWAVGPRMGYHHGWWENGQVPDHIAG